MKELTKRLKRQWPLLLLLLAMAALIAGPRVWREVAALLRQADVLRARLLALGPLAPVVYIALYALQIVAAPIPGSPFALASGYLFGPFAGGVYNVVGTALGLTAALWLSRRFGRPLVERLVGPAELGRWQRALRTESAWLWFAVFLTPVGDAAYYLAGLSRAPLRKLIVAGIISRLPGQFLMSWVGSHRGGRLVFLLILLALLSAGILLAWQRWGETLRARLLALPANQRNPDAVGTNESSSAAGEGVRHPSGEVPD